MIEISTIQDIRQIENKIIGGFTTKQLLTIVIGLIINIVCYIITKSTGLMMFISVIVLFIGFFKKDNLTAIESLKVCWDKQHQPRIRNYKNNNVISEIEKQCKMYKSSKKRVNKNKNRIIKSIVITLVFCSLPIVAFATELDTDISGYTEMLNMMKTYVRGAGAIVLMIGCADFFISFSNESTERLVKAMQLMGAGFFLILTDSFVQAIANADGTQTFNMLFNMIGLIISFIGAVLTMLGSYRVVNSIKERNAEVKSKAIKVVFCGLMLIAISRSLSAFL